MNYSKNANEQKTNPKRKKRRKKKNSVGVIILRILLVAFVIGIFAIGGALLGAYMGIIESAPTLNTADVVPESYTSIIYDSAGNEIDKLHGEENREYVKLEFIPKNLQNAVVAIEDERFYDHNGVDLKGMLRALIVNLKEKDLTQGASTLTQQLIKNEVLSSEKKIKRKLQEQYLAITFEKELEKQFNSKKKAKDYILELYLNTMSLNHGLNGVGAAAKFYFGKDVSELDLAECASIAGITKNPSLYSPLSNPEKNKERQILVLTKMKELGYITESQYIQAKSEDIYSNIVGNNAADDSAGAVHNYYIDSLVVSLANDLMADQNLNMNKQQAYDLIYSGGLKIYAAVDLDMQAIMEESYKNDDLFPPRGSKLDVSYTISIMDKATEKQTHTTRTTTVNSEEEAYAFAESVKNELLNSTNTFVLDNLSISDLQSAMVVMDYRTGEVKAIVGGRGEKTGDLVFNRATQALRQPGSCFKVLAGFAPAIDLGLMSPGTIIVDEPYTVNGWTPKNWYSGYRGPSTVREGVKDSMNILAAKTIMQVGVDRAYDYLLNFGFTTLVDSKEINGKIYSDKSPATVLGGVTEGVTVLELTAAYGAIANNGEYNKPIFYTKVLDHKGNVLLENTPQPKRVLKETSAWLLTDMMKDVVSGGGTGGLARFKNVKMPIAGKTGTTTDDKDLTFAGYTPYYVAGIWLGYDSPKKINYKKSYHLLLWSDVMEKIHQGFEYKDFDKPAGIVSRSYCGVSSKAPIAGVCENDYYGGGISTDYCAADSPGTSGTCDVHKSFRIDMSTGQLANEYCPEDSVSSVVLAVNENDDILNLPSEASDGKVLIDLHSSCTAHNAETKAAEDIEKNKDVIGADDPFLPPTEDDPTQPNPGGTQTPPESNENPIPNQGIGTEETTPPSNEPIPPTTENNDDGLFVAPPHVDTPPVVDTPIDTPIGGETPEPEVSGADDLYIPD